MRLLVGGERTVREQSAPMANAQTEAEEILEWCYSRGTRLNHAQVYIWNEFARKLGWNDRGAQFLAAFDAQRTAKSNGEYLVPSYHFDIEVRRA